MRAPGSRPTARGIALLAAGAAVTLAGASIGEPDVVWVGLLLLGLPLAALVAVRLLRPALVVARRVDPQEAPIGSRPRVVLDLRNDRPLALSALSFSDRAPSAFGSDARFFLSRGLGRWRQQVAYDLIADQRGHFRLGPLTATAHDPLDLARTRFPVPGDDATLRVTPRVWDLARLGKGLGTGSAGESTPQRIGLAGQDDVLVREHRHGDDLRRVHWRISAKQGELMVRLEEHPWDPAVTLLLDVRASAHFGEGPEGSLEWVVSLGASVATQLLAARHRLTILSPDAEVFAPGHADQSSAGRRMLQQLTDLEASARSTLVAGLSDADSLSNARSLLAALGLLTAADAAALAAVGSRMSQCAALVPDAQAFGADPAAALAHDDGCRLLASSGWTIQRYRPDEAVPHAWSALLAGRSAR